MFRNPYKKFVYLFILLVPLFVLLTQPKILTPFKASVIKIIAGPFHFFQATLLESKKIIFYHRSFNEYQRLKKDNDTLRARLVGMEELLRENTRLQKSLQFKREFIHSSVAANVIGRDPSRWHSSIIIDKGTSSAITEGMAVVNALGVIGKIMEVMGETSKVVVLTDPQFSVAALVQRSRESGILSGTLDGRCRLGYLAETADIQVGDLVLTSKLSSSFPEGIIIGEIIEIHENIGHQSKEAVVEPAVVISQVEDVIVILK